MTGLPAGVWIGILGFVLDLVAGPVRADARTSRVVLLVPEHKIHQAAAVECREALRSEGLDPLFVTVKRDQITTASAPARPPAEATAGLIQERSATTQTSTPADSSPLLDREVLAQIAAAGPALVIAFGEPAAVACLNQLASMPVVYSMVPNVLDSPLATDPEHRRRAAGVTTDFPPLDALKWARQVQQGATRVAVLHSVQTRRTADSIRSAGGEINLHVGLIETSTDEFAAAIDKLQADRYDAVLMLADAQVYNTASIKRLLLWGIRQKKGIWSFSENFVRAGALGCLHASPEEMGRLTAKVSLDVLSGREPSKIGIVYPKSMGRALNQRTAKLIGLPLPQALLNGVMVVGDD